MENSEIKRELLNRDMSSIKVLEMKLNDLKSRLEKGEKLSSTEVNGLLQSMQVMDSIGAAW
jgi:hypothetical protein